MKKRRAAPAYTLVELIIALTIFSVVAILCVQALVTSMASAKRIQAQVFLYTEAQALMNQLAREVERNTVDYEAYYLRYGYSSPETGWETADYGFYGQAFFHPGDDGWDDGPYGTNVGSLYGAECPSDGSSVYPDACPTETPNYDDLDLDTGAHPFTEIYDFYGTDDDPAYMNAFCESTTSTTVCNTWAETVMTELILINGAGDERTVFAQEGTETSGEYVISLMKLSGTDTDSDGLVDTWVCGSDFDACTGTGNIPASGDLTDANDPSDGDFMPIVPSALNIESFYIYIAPFEDPYRAFGEEAVQIQPQVTIVFTATLSDEYSNMLLGDVPEITIQRTVSTGVYAEVSSYE